MFRDKAEMPVGVHENLALLYPIPLFPIRRILLFLRGRDDLI